MSKQDFTPRPIKALEISPIWIAAAKAIIAQDHHEARAGVEMVGGQLLTFIEILAPSTGTWHPLNLPNNQLYFATPADRDAVLNQIK